MKTSLRRGGSRIPGCILLVLMFAPGVLAQEASVIHPVNLRPNPATTNPRIELLEPGASLILLEPGPKSGFYHVKAADGQEGWVWSKNVTIVTAVSAVAPTSTECDDALWQHVYNTQRLIVKQKCVSITGTIVDATDKRQPDGVRHEPDGDSHGWLDLDPQYKNLLNAGNMSAERGNMVFEIVCMFHVSQQDAKASCLPPYHNEVQIPPIGSHVRIVGTYVQDTNHSQWMEIHPVTSITVVP